MTWDKFKKLTELVKRRITQTVLYKLKDPRVGFVTITRVELARDLKTCKVFFTVYGSKGEVSKTTAALSDACGFIQREVAQTLRTRTMPRITFSYDTTIERLERVHRIIDTISAQDPDEESMGDPGGSEGKDDGPPAPEEPE